jgi:starch synthase
LIRVLHVASEVTPWSQTGGLGEVMAGLPPALAAADPSLAIALVSPLYRVVRERAAARGASFEDIGLEIAVSMPAADHAARLLRLVTADSGAVPQFFLDCPPLYDRDGVYGTAAGDHPDSAVRFAFLCRAAIAAAHRMLGGPPDIFHLHDWAAAPVALYLRRLGHAARSIVTVHNLRYQGRFDAGTVIDIGLDWSLYTHRCLEHHGRASFLKGGMAAADAITTVSPSYAAEILTPRHGDSLDGFLRHDVGRVVGITNGIDAREWDPSTDVLVPARYSASDLSGKARCRDALAAERGLEVNAGTLLVGVVSRLVEQKGPDLIADVVPELAALGAKLVLLGSGDADMERRFRALADEHRAHVSIDIGFEPALARRIFAGSDAILMPSRSEPCGLTQMYAMRYGAIPIVNPVGGLRDTVLDPGDAAPGEGTGLAMTGASAAGLRAAVERAAILHRDRPAWRALVGAAMTRDFSWRGPAGEYLALYRRLLA